MIKKRTQAEIDHSIDVDKDYTGGYDYLNWIIFNGDGRAYIIASILIMAFGIVCFCTLQSSNNINFQIGAGIGAVIVSIVIATLSKLSFSHLKRGSQSL